MTFQNIFDSTDVTDTVYYYGITTDCYHLHQLDQLHQQNQIQLLLCFHGRHIIFVSDNPFPKSNVLFDF